MVNFFKKNIKIYFFNLTIKANLHPGNVEEITKKQLEHLLNQYDPDFVTEYKKKVFLKWYDLNKECNVSFIFRLKKLIRKLDITFLEHEKEYINSIYSKRLALDRAFKTIEVPYLNYVGDEDKKKICKDTYFSYLHIYVYEPQKILLKLKSIVDIYLSFQEIILFNKESEKTSIVYANTIKSITLSKIGVEINLKRDDNKIVLRYKDNEILYISLSRCFKKEKIKFKNLLEKY